MTLTGPDGQRYVSEWLYAESESDELCASLADQIKVGGLDAVPDGFATV